MKAFLIGILFILGMAALPAAAEHERSRAFGFRPDFRVQQAPPGQFKGNGGRDVRRERPADRRGERPQGRLSEEERRELRRDLDKANRELYRRRFDRR